MEITQPFTKARSRTQIVRFVFSYSFLSLSWKHPKSGYSQNLDLWLPLRMNLVRSFHDGSDQLPRRITHPKRKRVWLFLPRIQFRLGCSLTLYQWENQTWGYGCWFSGHLPKCCSAPEAMNNSVKYHCFRRACVPMGGEGVKKQVDHLAWRVVLTTMGGIL